MADQHLETTSCTCWHSWRFGRTARPQAEKVRWVWGDTGASLHKGERLLGQKKFRVGSIECNTPGLGIEPWLSSMRGFKSCLAGLEGWSAYCSSAAAHMQPPTLCLWHCCPSLNQTPGSLGEDANHSFLLISSHHNPHLLKLSRHFRSDIHQKKNITKAPWIILSVLLISATRARHACPLAVA